MLSSRTLFLGTFIAILLMFGSVRVLLIGSPLIVSAANNATNAPEQAAVPVQQEAPAPAAEQQDAACTIATSYPQTIRQWCGLIQRYAQANGLDPNLVSAVMLQESAGQSDAYSKSGAVGLMQVMPRDGKASTFQCKNGPCFADRPSMDQLFDPEYNIAYGTRMLADLIQRHGNPRDALRAYGPMDVGYYYADLVLGILQTHQ